MIKETDHSSGLSKNLPPSKELTPPSITILAIDIGSTSIKIEIWRYANGNFQLIADQRPWIDYDPEIVELDNHDQIKILRQSALDKIIAAIENKAALCKDQLNSSLFLNAVTGFNHSLVLSYQGENAVILDDPTPAVIPTKSQLDILNNYLDQEQINLLSEKPSTLGKIIYLLNHPEIIKQLFGREELNLTDLQFSTMRGLIAKTITGRTQLSVPQSEIRSFANWQGGQQQLKQMLIELGLQTGQIHFESSNFISAPNGHAFDCGDFEGEQQSCLFVLEQQNTDPKTIFVALDTVGKTSAQYENMPKKLEMGYNTQRMTARVNKDWMRKLATECTQMVDVYPFVDQILREALNTGLETPYLFYPTENGLGILIKTDGKSYQKISRAEAAGKDLNERKKIILAIALGIAFGLRQKIEGIRTANNIDLNQNICLYGGLVGKNKQGIQWGWREIFLEAFPPASINILDLPSGASAAAFAALNRLGWSSAWKNNFSLKTELLGQGNPKSEKYQAWLEKQQALIAEQKLLLDNWQRMKAVT